MKTILVVDDDQTFADMVRASLDSAKYTIVAAGDGQKGLEAMKSLTPDLILLDIRMPNMNGIQFLQELNKTGKKPHVIITSNDSSLETISEGTKYGIQAYILKSNETLKTITDMVQKLLNEKV